MSQLALQLPFRPSLGADDFLVAPGNAEAVAWLDAWPDWPGPALALYGPEGCGKTHLAHVFAARAGARILVPADFAAGAAPSALSAGCRAVAVDDADRLPDGPPGAGRAGAEEVLLHLYNHLAGEGGHLLLTGRTPPAAWPTALADLGSRLRAAPVAGVALPDDQLLAGLLVKLFADRGLAIEPGVVSLLVQRIHRSFAAARATVAALDRAALERGRRVSPALVREVLAAQGGDAPD